ncbi:MAG: LuxR C-terminal-related transcriptional regulator [Acidimicrobiales bacterium]
MGVAVAHEQALFRVALSAALAAEPGIVIVAAAGSAGDACRVVAEATPDVVVIDAALPPAGGAAACAEIKARGHASRCLVQSDWPDPAVLAAAVEAGADGYLDRSRTLTELVGAIRRLARGEAVVPPEMLGALLRHLIDRGRDEAAAINLYSRLSRREREVAALLVEGLDTLGIAERLIVSRHTARTHVQNVLTKLGVHSRFEAADLVTRHDLLGRLPAAAR